MKKLPSNVIGPRISMAKFHYDRETQTFSQEISSLERGRIWNQLYNDACDIGFVMVSHITGNEVPFYLSGEDMQDDEIAGWRFKSAGGFRFECLIIND